jgi:hypothetical protein
VRSGFGRKNADAVMDYDDAGIEARHMNQLGFRVEDVSHSKSIFKA